VHRFTTIVSVISPAAGEIVDAVAAGAANVTAVRQAHVEAGGEPSRRRLAWAEAARGRNIYTLVDFDPAQPLVDAWVARLGGDPHAMDTVSGVVGQGGLAEYFLVADDVAGERVHWYHGLLHSLAPRRVVPIESRPASVVDSLAHLRPSPPFPDAATLVRAALSYVPTGLSADASDEPATLVIDVG
jgi:hypothetical protein